MVIRSVPTERANSPIGGYSIGERVGEMPGSRQTSTILVTKKGRVDQLSNSSGELTEDSEIYKRPALLDWSPCSTLDLRPQWQSATARVIHTLSHRSEGTTTRIFELGIRIWQVNVRALDQVEHH